MTFINFHYFAKKSKSLKQPKRLTCLKAKRTLLFIKGEFHGCLESVMFSVSEAWGVKLLSHHLGFGYG